MRRFKAMGDRHRHRMYRVTLAVISTLALVILPLILNQTTRAEEELPVIESNAPVVSIRDGDAFHEHAWGLAPEVNPDTYEAQLSDGKPHLVTFITDVDSITFLVEEERRYDFIIRYGDALCHTQIIGIRHVPPADFDEEYQRRTRGRTVIEIPEVYELVNIALALTPTLAPHEYMVYRKSEYYNRMLERFGGHESHPLVATFDSLLRVDFGYYAALKMNGYAFEFDEDGALVQSQVYNRIGFSSTNALRPYIPVLQTFADETGFREFYRENSETYAGQIAFYRDSMNLEGMVAWLDVNFPGSGAYDAYKVVFSPLVYGWQNSYWVESNGFTELQAHVNFPYPHQYKDAGGEDSRMSTQAERLLSGATVFTEINHGYINPEADKYGERVADAVSCYGCWVDTVRGPAYYQGAATFLEYLNWGLIDLLAVDILPEGEARKVFAEIDRTMIGGRGFHRFDAFSRFLVNLYSNRVPGKTVADLYPEIIGWFELNSKGTTDR